jgi:hypothetical protein
MGCLNKPSVPTSDIPGLSTPTVTPGLPSVALGGLLPCCGGTIGGAINPADFLPPLPIPPGPIVPTPIIVALQLLITTLNAAVDALPLSCPLDSGED